MSESIRARRGRLLAALALLAGVAALVLVGPGAMDARAATTTIDDCEAGTYFDAATDTCVDAPEGTFVADDKAPSPTPCPVGTYQDQTKQTRCEDVPIGSEATGAAADGTRATGVRLCPQGTFQDEPSRAACKPIPLGRAGTGGGDDGRGSTGTTACAIGTFRGDAATTGCLPAPAGTFVADEGRSAPTPCPAGRFQDGTGKPECKVIPLGSGGSGGLDDGTRSTGTTLCATGTFRGDATTTRCTPAPAGRFVATTGATSATACSVGTFQPATGQTSCIPAPAGSFVPTTGSNAAALCRPGTYMGSTGASQCTTASRGYYVPRAGATSQLACASSTTTGATTCESNAVPADEGLDDGVSLRADGDPCPPGTWSETGTVPPGGTCIPARPGTFVAGEGGTAELDCPPGTFSDSFGLDACVTAPPGTYVPVAGSAEPLPCEGSTILGATECDEVSLATPAVLEDTPARTGMGSSSWLLILGGVLGVGAGVLFLFERRRPGFLATLLGGGGNAKGPSDRTKRAATAEPAPPAPPDAATTDVLEWDELLDDPEDL